MTKRLRLAHVLVQPVLVWDDGEEITPGPQLGGVALPLSQVADELAKIPAQLGELEAQILAAETPVPKPPPKPPRKARTRPKR
jgi:hypothetical protein